MHNIFLSLWNRNNQKKINNAKRRTTRINFYVLTFNDCTIFGWNCLAGQRPQCMGCVWLKKFVLATEIWWIFHLWCHCECHSIIHAAYGLKDLCFNYLVLFSFFEYSSNEWYEWKIFYENSSIWMYVPQFGTMESQTSMPILCNSNQMIEKTKVSFVAFWIFYIAREWIDEYFSHQ